MPPHLKKDFLKLIEKYLDGTASAEEMDLIEDYYAHFSNDPDVTNSLHEEEINVLKASFRHDINNRIEKAEKPVVPIYRKTYFRVAASILLFLSISVFVVNKLKRTPVQLQAQNHDLAPGGNKAILTLADGSKVNLDNLKNGSLTVQPGAHVAKQSGQLNYKATADNSTPMQISYNTLTTPRGGQYRLTLPDGTMVWLNAASSLKYPTTFSGSERVVELTGEAYFEVAHNAKQPFKVKANGQTIEDIGTQFDVNSYADEDAVATTLVEGSVKIYSAKEQTMMKPGQQYLSKADGSSQLKSDVDIDEATAWKNGMFQFNNADIRTIMRQVSRWYNVDVEYRGPVPASTYHGRISRNSNASAVLQILALGGINFTMEGGKIIVK